MSPNQSIDPKLNRFYQMRGVNSFREQDKVHECADGTIKLVSAVLDSLEGGDFACVSIIQKAWDEGQIGVKHTDTRPRDAAVLSDLGMEILSTHPDTALLLQSVAISYNGNRYLATRQYLEDFPRFIDNLNSRSEPGVLEARAVINQIESFSYLENRDADREKMTLLMAGEALIHRLERRGADCSLLRDDFKRVAADRFNYGEEPYRTYIKFESCIQPDIGQDPRVKTERYDDVVINNLNPLFRMMQAYAGERNHFADSLNGYLLVFRGFLKTATNELSKSTRPWLYEGEFALSATNVNHVADLFLKSISLKATVLEMSLKAKGQAYYLFFKNEGELLPETSSLRDINAILDTLDLDKDVRKSSYTNLLEVVVRLAGSIEKDSLANKDKVDDLLLELIKHADVESVFKKIEGRISDTRILTGTVQRHAPELMSVVPLAAKGQAFVDELGV